MRLYVVWTPRLTPTPRPASSGGAGYLLSSETCAFDLVGAELLRSVNSNTLITPTPAQQYGNVSIHQHMRGPAHPQSLSIVRRIRARRSWLVHMWCAPTCHCHLAMLLCREIEPGEVLIIDKKSCMNGLHAAHSRPRTYPLSHPPNGQNCRSCHASKPCIGSPLDSGHAF